MKITKVCMKHGERQRPVTVELDAIVETMRSERGRRCRSQLVFSGTFGRQGFSQLKRMNGLLLLTTDDSDQPTVDEWQRRVMDIPYTMLSFRSGDRRRLHVIVNVARADGAPSADAEAHLHLLRKAQQMVTPVYESLCGCQLLRQELTLESGCPLESDPQALYRPEAQAFPVIIKTDDPLVQYRHEQVEQDGSTCHADDAEERERQQLEFYSCVQNVEERMPADVDAEQLLIALASQCRRAQLDEESSVRRTLWLPQYERQEDIVRKVFRTVYARRTANRPRSAINEKESIARSIRDFFRRRYQLRYNVVKQQTEFRSNDLQTYEWQPLSEQRLKQIAFEEMLEGGKGWMIDIELYVHSTLIPRHHPILAFLGGCGQWDQRHNYIEDYARRLKTDYEHWPHFFHRWLLAMVAQAMGKSRDYGNSMVPLLIGAQAMKKSTFCKNILPPALREYYMDDIKMDNAEQVERVLGRMWLVNIDEYNAKTDREQAKIKRLLTEKDVQVRKMRSDEYTMTPRLCSFIATTNDRQPLCDPTGSRRYLCVEMTGQANMEGTTDYRQMYAQAVYELEHGAQYWFDNDDEREITAHNQRYQQCTTAEELLTDLFVPAERCHDHFLTTTAIQQHLSSRLRPADVPTLRKLGLALKRLHFPEGSQGGQHGYYLHQRE